MSSVHALASVWLAGCAPDLPGGRAAVETTRVRRGDLELALVEKGRVEAKQTTTVYAPVEGEIVWLCEEGTQVKAGDTVARFANEEIEDLHQDAKVQCEAAERRVARAKRGTEMQKRELELDVERQQSLLALAKWELADLALDSRQTVAYACYAQPDSSGVRAGLPNANDAGSGPDTLP